MAGALIVAAALLAQAAPAPATTPAAHPDAASAPTTVSPLVVSRQVPISKRREVDLDAVTCHNETPVGTRFPTRVCATNRQFAERTREQQEMVREWLNTPVTTSTR